MSLFSSKIGTCDWCFTEGISLFEYEGMKICNGCREELRDHRSPMVKKIEEDYQETLSLLDRIIE